MLYNGSENVKEPKIPSFALFSSSFRARGL
jgi:hypothetical protein